MSSALVTVIIPTYKRPHLVVRAINSVLVQTHRQLEVLVVDDCSQDDTQSAVVAIGDSRVRYLQHNRNKGLPAARNTGIRAAQGEYIAFLDDDDQWRTDKIEKQLQKIRQYDAVACTAMSSANGCAMRTHRNTVITLDDLRRGSFAPSGLLARTSVLRDVMFDEDIAQGEDWDAFIRIAQRYSIGWVPEPLLLYNDGGHGRMTNEAKALFGPDLERRAAVLYKHRQFFGEKWFKYHLADTFLSYIGSRSNKIECIRYAVQRCGVRPVISSLLGKIRNRFARKPRLGWT